MFSQPPNPVSPRIKAFNSARLPHTVQYKYQKMAQDAFSFYRGTAHLFYEDLHHAPLLPANPTVWLCGDLHPENFGSYKGDNRQVYFDISDFDEGILGPALLDVSRMTTGIFVAFEALKLSAKDAETAAITYLTQYAETLAGGKASRIETAIATGLVKDLLEKVAERKREKWLAKRMEETKQSFALKEVEGKQLKIKDDDLKAALIQHISGLPLEGNGRSFSVLDVCFRLAGTGSLGLKRYSFLLETTGDKKRHWLLDMKQAHPSCLSPYVQEMQPPWRSEAERIVAVEARMQDVAQALLTTTIFRGDAYKLEEMQPTEDKVALEDVRDTKKIFDLLANTGMLTASAQLRSAGRDGSAIADSLIAFGKENGWQNEVLQHAKGHAQKLREDYRLYRTDFENGFFKLMD